MAIRFYSHEFKLFITGVLAFLAVHYSTKFYLSLPIKGLPPVYYNVVEEVVNLALYSVVLSVLTYKFFGGNEPGKYYIMWFWSLFINYYFFHVIPYFPFNLGVLTGAVSSLLYAIPPSLVMSAVRIGKSEEANSLPTPQLWAGTVMFSALILLSFYTGVTVFTFIYGAVAGLLLSFIAVGTEKTMVNLSLVPMFIIALVYTGGALYHVTTATLLLVFGASFLIFWVSMKPAVLINRNTGDVIPIGVVSSQTLSLVFPLVVAIIWAVVRHLASAFNYGNYISPLTLETFPIIFLPAVIGNTLSDYLRGRQLEKYMRFYGKETGVGIIGGVGLADGLWLDLVGVITYYLTVLKFGFYDGTLVYVLIIIPALVIVSRLI